MKEVSIPLDRYEELLNLETRVNVAVERVKHEDCFYMKDLLWILGTEESIDVANEMQKKEDERRKYFETAKKTD